MTALLEQALTEVHKLSPEQQDGIAALILEEIADQSRWNRAFAQSQDILGRIATKVRRDKRAGNIHQKGMDDL